MAGHTCIFHCTVFLVIFCSFTEVHCLDDDLYTCSGWDKRCIGHRDKLGEFKEISGDYFNCYFGYSPICTTSVTAGEINRTNFCQKLNRNSKYNPKFKFCTLEAKLLDKEEEENHYRQLRHFDL